MHWLVNTTWLFHVCKRTPRTALIHMLTRSTSQRLVGHQPVPRLSATSTGQSGQAAVAAAAAAVRQASGQHVVKQRYELKVPAAAAVRRACVQALAGAAAEAAPASAPRPPLPAPAFTYPLNHSKPIRILSRQPSEAQQPSTPSLSHAESSQGGADGSAHTFTQQSSTAPIQPPAPAVATAQQAVQTPPLQGAAAAAAGISPATTSRPVVRPPRPRPRWGFSRHGTTNSLPPSAVRTPAHQQQRQQQQEAPLAGPHLATLSSGVGNVSVRGVVKIITFEGEDGFKIAKIKVGGFGNRDKV